MDVRYPRLLDRYPRHAWPQMFGLSGNFFCWAMIFLNRVALGAYGFKHNRELPKCMHMFHNFLRGFAKRYAVMLRVVQSK